MNKSIYLLSGGGHGRVVLDALLNNGTQVSGLIDSGFKVGEQIFDVQLLKGNEPLEQLDPSEVLLVNGLGANPYTNLRKNIFYSMKKKGFSFMTVQHPSVIIGCECKFGEGSQIMAGSVIQNRVHIGDNAVINTGAIIEHDCVIGPHVFISPGAVLCGGVIIDESAFVAHLVVTLSRGLVPSVKKLAGVSTRSRGQP